MKLLQKIGLAIFLLALGVFTSGLFLGEFKVTEKILNETLNENHKKHLLEFYEEELVGNTFSNTFSVSSIIIGKFEEVNNELKAQEKWDEVMWDSPHDLSYSIIKPSGIGFFALNKQLMFFFTFGLGILGSLLYILPNFILLGPPGIKNNEMFQHPATSKGWIGYSVFVYLVSFYVLLYFFPDYIINWVYIVDPVAQLISGGEASQWFLYGFLYCSVMTVMAVRMYVKYRHNKYQIFRTSTVLFFQIAFAFLIPEIMVQFNLPYMDLKNAWPLDYDFFFAWNLDNFSSFGSVGIFLIFWGVILTLIIVPVGVYFWGKRWYCSWVCGCGGLAETLGDPYRQLSDKSLKAWKGERWVIHGVLAFAILMTGATLITRYTGVDSFLFVKTYDLQKYYGFLIGSIFSGVIGTGFYPVFGNRVWCRFGCPLAAYMGLIQRFKSRFRITTNGAQCISCGNCSTYCEQGIDVRWYAQRGQNIVRSSCVGCGVCSAVCPRGVLKLENGPEEDRFNDKPIMIGKNNAELFELPEIG